MKLIILLFVLFLAAYVLSERIVSRKTISVYVHIATNPVTGMMISIPISSTETFRNNDIKGEQNE